MLKLKLQYFGHLMQRTDSLEKTLMLGKIEGLRDKREWDGWMAPPPWCTWLWARSRTWWWTGTLVCCSPWGQKKSDNSVTELNWTQLGSSFHWVRQGCGPCDQFDKFSVTLVFILPALWQMRIRSLWKLPVGRDWLCGNWVLFWWVGPCLVNV